MILDCIYLPHRLHGAQNFQIVPRNKHFHFFPHYLKVFIGRGGDRSEIENVLVIFSDGNAHDITEAYRAADSMKDKNIRIIATTVSEYGYVREELLRIASSPKYAISIELSNTAHYAKKLVSIICQTNL